MPRPAVGYRSVGVTDVKRNAAVVHMVDSAAAALDSVRRAIPDVIVTDLAMPGADGRWLVQELRKTPRAFAIPVVAVTAHRYRFDRDSILREGCDEYLTKPLSPQALCEAIARLTGRSTLQRLAAAASITRSRWSQNRQASRCSRTLRASTWNAPTQCRRFQ